ncbi:hypothetical protein [Brevundimonas sp.]|uniref:hypothetical protein n=1 Tax=Brevundimonas sp. TaxID=1871086 RepID=UPI00286B8233|nr:hypothetical protein [Brevundimonas sp.]
MTNYKDETLSGRVTLDGGVFDNCDFLDVQMMYSGGTPPQFLNCRFNEATFTFDGPANDTLLFLRSMAARTTGMRPVVESLIPELSN